MESAYTLRQVASENLHTHGSNGDVSPEVLADMGVTLPHELESVIKTGRSMATHAEDSTPRPAPKRQPRLFEMPGQNRGRNNPDNQPLSHAEIIAGLSPEEITSRDAANKAGVAAVREALKHGHFGRVGGH